MTGYELVKAVQAFDGLGPFKSYQQMEERIAAYMSSRNA